LGDAQGERLASGSVRFTFKQSVIHKEYIFWLSEFFRINGLCSNNLPLVSKHNNYLAYYFITYSFSNFIWIYKMFYTHNKIKRVPLNIHDYLTPLALAIWIMDDGTWKESGVRIATHSFKITEVELLRSVLESKFNLKVTLHTNNTKKVLYIKNESMNNLRSIILPHFHKSMYYKLGL
jgi:ubiquinol-cytochrome c reductase cytochrome b subunit